MNQKIDNYSNVQTPPQFSDLTNICKNDFSKRLVLNKNGNVGNSYSMISDDRPVSRGRERRVMNTHLSKVKLQPLKY